MRNPIKALIAATITASALLLGATPVSASEPIVVTSIKTPVQIDRCGPEVDESGAFLGPAWYYWSFGKDAGVSKTLITWLDGSGYQVRADARPGYVIADGVQTVWEFPAFTNEPC
jgi:hypothetical protein